jgi:hypothetical protein
VIAGANTAVHFIQYIGLYSDSPEMSCVSGKTISRYLAHVPHTYVVSMIADFNTDTVFF